MKLVRNYPKNTLVTFKWYDNLFDEFEKNDNYRLVDGLVKDQFNGVCNVVYAYNGHENRLYAVDSDLIIKEICYEATN